jgi:predicted dehydrogenase
MTIGIAIIGYGYWGPNLLRNFSANRNCRVTAIADTSAHCREKAMRMAPGVQVFEDAAEAIRQVDTHLVAIATPVASHYKFAKLALESGRDVLIEKPLTASVQEAEDLVARAHHSGRQLFVDHTFLFTDAVRKIVDLVRSEELGDICYYDSMRVNLGLFQPDVNVLWDLAPHDLSIIDRIFGAEPIHIEANGYCHVNPGVPDISYVTLHYPGNKVAHLNLSWMSPVKVRRVAIGGTKQMLIWDDLAQDEKIKIYNAGIELHTPAERTVIVPGYRTGDVLSPRLMRSEALANVVEHIVGVLTGEEHNDILSGERGLRVVRVLESAQQRLKEEAHALLATLPATVQ